MKKTTLLLFLAVFFQYTQAQIIQLKFTALLNGTHVNIDSVQITNLTHPGNTVLHWPDTSFILGYVGLPNVTDNDNSGLNIRLCSENPVVSEALIQLSLPAKSDVFIRVSDVSGRVLCQINENLQRGRHFFKYSPNTEGISIITVSTSTETKSMKVISTGHNNGFNMIDYAGFAGERDFPKSVNSALSFEYSIGDSLLLTGWYNGIDSSFSAAPQTSTNYSFNFTLINACPGIPTFTYGGQVYHTVQIGTQCWMRENLNIGTMINGSGDQTDNGITEKYCYNNDPLNCNIYGGLYQWNEMMQYFVPMDIQGICPNGWHIPTNDEFSTLGSYLGGNNIAGAKLKETGFDHWDSPNTGATNETGFTGLGGGCKVWPFGFGGLNSNTWFWTSSAYDFSFYYEGDLNSQGTNLTQNFNAPNCGFSVRCVKN